jgi:hypothetical protein
MQTLVLREEPMPTCANRITSPEEKLEISQAVSTRYSQWYADQELGGGRCFYWSLTLRACCSKRGIAP